MLVMLGTSVYQDDFERHFLKVSAEFYKVCKTIIMYYYLILSFKMWKEFFPYYG